MSHPHTHNGACGHQKNCTSDRQKNPPHNSAVSPRSLPRCSQPLSTNQTPHPTTKDGATTTNPHTGSRPNTSGQTISGFPHSGRRDSGLVASKPNSVSGSSSPQNPTRRLNPVAAQRLSCTRPDTHYRCRPSNESTRSPNSHRRGRAWFSWCSLERR